MCKPSVATCAITGGVTNLGMSPLITRRQKVPSAAQVIRNSIMTRPESNLKVNDLG